MKYLVLIAFFTATTALADTTVSASGEFGTVGVHQHKIKFGKDGTRFDYRNKGGQDILYPFQRFEASLAESSGARWVFLYNPLRFETQTTLTEDTKIDGTDFSAGTPMNLIYSFPFYRVSYCSAPCGAKAGFYYGAGLQIRNASIIFEAKPSGQRVVNQNVGPVPLIKVGYATKLWDGMLQIETDSMYAPVKILNGSDSDVVGGFSDSHLAYFVPTAEASNVGLRLRYLGGGAQGTSEDEPGGSDGYTENWIDLFAFSMVINHSFR